MDKPIKDMTPEERSEFFKKWSWRLIRTGLWISGISLLGMALLRLFA